MPLPVDLGTVTVTATYVDLATGDPLQGAVTFKPTRGIAAVSSPDVFYVARPINVPLDEDGAISVELPVTNDPQYTPEFAWEVHEKLGPGSRPPYLIQLDTTDAGETHDLADITPVADLDGYSAYMPTAGGSFLGDVTFEQDLTVEGQLAVTGTLDAATIDSVDYTATVLPLGISGAVATGLVIRSSPDGGEDEGQPGQYDSTGRVNLYSFQRADVGSYGENIRRFLMRDNAKSMDAWYMPRENGQMSHGYNGSGVPDSNAQWVPVAWTGAHWEANDGASIHGHWSVEVPDLTGAVQTRFEVPFTDQEAADVDKKLGVEVTNISTNLADLTVRANLGLSGEGKFRIGGGNSVNKDILLSISANRADSGRRWAIRANTTTEAGSNVGTDFQILGYSDAGALIAPHLTIQRSTGNAAFGTTTVSTGKVNAAWATSGLHGFYAAPTSSPGSGSAFAHTAQASTDRTLDAKVTGDASSRFVAYADGKLEIGPGSGSRDTNLYRSAADTLKTDDSFIVSTKATVGTTTLQTSQFHSQSAGTVSAGFFKATADGTASLGVVAIEGFSASKRLLDLRVTGDSVARVKVDSSGTSGGGAIILGDGTTSDTNLYRSAADTLKTDDSFHVGATLRHLGTSLGFYNTAAATKQTVTGSRGSNAALTSLLTALATIGLITDSSS